jgi:uncharacterized membrane protein YeaQ/YmgE (transglycosylase-associated protein family)
LLVSGIITAVVIGAVVGLGARLVIPQEQRPGIGWTLFVSVVASYAGLWTAHFWRG